MIEVVKVSLENEMDLTLAYKKSIKAAELLGLTLSTQTAFATAVSEVSREIIDKTFDGVARLGVAKDDDRFFLTAIITFRQDNNLKKLQESFQYAKKLVPVLEISSVNGQDTVMLQLGIPRSAKINKTTIEQVKDYFEKEGPSTPYEEVKKHNLRLSKITEEQEVLLKQSQYINEQKNEFLSVASHELKNPLTIIKAYAQLARASKEECGPVMTNYLKKIEHQAIKLHTLIQQLFDVSKIESGQFDYKLELVNINSYLEEVVDLIKYTVPAHEIKLELGENIYIANIDKIRIEQVLTNLIGNAAKYSSPQSVIEVDVFLGKSNFLTISVKDYGIGMSQDTLTKVFEKFYRSEAVLKKYTGLGMGLYIASKIVSDHGGKIWVESTEGNGSIFYFNLPLQAQPEEIFN